MCAREPSRFGKQTVSYKIRSEKQYSFLFLQIEHKGNKLATFSKIIGALKNCVCLVCIFESFPGKTFLLWIYKWILGK